MPFLQRVHRRTMLPVLVGPAAIRTTIAALLDAVVDPGTVVLCSTDLSHYLTDDEARRRDAATAAAIGDLAPERIGDGDACGRHALRGLLAWARPGRCGSIGSPSPRPPTPAGRRTGSSAIRRSAFLYRRP